MIKTGCTLIGIYLFASGLATLSTLPRTLFAYDQDLHEFAVPENWPNLAVGILVAVEILWLLPSALLIRFAPSIAGRLGEREPKTEMSATELYLVLALALAVYYLVNGLANPIRGLVLTGS